MIFLTGLEQLFMRSWSLGMWCMTTQFLCKISVQQNNVCGPWSWSLFLLAASLCYSVTHPFLTRITTLFSIIERLGTKRSYMTSRNWRWWGEAGRGKCLNTSVLVKRKLPLVKIIDTLFIFSHYIEIKMFVSKCNLQKYLMFSTMNVSVVHFFLFLYWDDTELNLLCYAPQRLSVRKYSFCLESILLQFLFTYFSFNVE